MADLTITITVPDLFVADTVAAMRALNSKYKNLSDADMLAASTVDFWKSAYANRLLSAAITQSNDAIGSTLQNWPSPVSSAEEEGN